MNASFQMVKTVLEPWILEKLNVFEIDGPGECTTNISSKYCFLKKDGKICS